MAAQTDDAFDTWLNEDLGWRRIELLHLKRALDSASKTGSDTPATRALSRSVVAMSYAHWEGYSKNSLEKYAQLVSRRKPRLSEARGGLVLEHVRRLMKRVASGDRDASNAIILAVQGGSDARVNIEKSRLSDTKANLRFGVLSDLFAQGCIPIDEFELKANLIDVLLCDRRNDVAHGRALFVPAPESLQLCDDVISLLETMRDVLSSQVRGKKYLDSP